MNEYKTHTCNEISLEDVGKKVRIADGYKLSVT